MDLTDDVVVSTEASSSTTLIFFIGVLLLGDVDRFVLLDSFFFSSSSSAHCLALSLCCATVDRGVEGISSLGFFSFTGELSDSFLYIANNKSRGFNQ